MFVQDHVRDFDAVLSAPRPFAFVRFGDGEACLLERQQYISADTWRHDGGSSWLEGPLRDAISYVDDHYCVGLPMQCCLAKYVAIGDLSRTPVVRMTFATLFLHINLGRAQEILDRFANAVIVGCRFGEIRIPTDGVSSAWDLDAVVEQLLGVDRPILIAGGPAAKVIVHRYWSRQTPDRRQTIVDVGSALDFAFGGRTRHYHNDDSHLRQHTCRWIMRGAAAPSVQQQQERITMSTRIRVGSPGTGTTSTGRGITVREGAVGTGKCPTCVKQRVSDAPCTNCPKGAKIRG